MPAFQSLVDTTDVHIYTEIMKGTEDDMFLKGFVLGKGEGEG